MKSELQMAMEVLAEQQAAIAILQAREAQHLEHIKALELAIVKEFGAHGVLVCQYSDPSLSRDERRKAASACLAYEKAKVGDGRPQQVQFHLYSHLENARRKRIEAAKVIDVTPAASPA